MRKALESEPVMATIGERIYELRTSNGMSQKTLADKCRVSKFSISTWESGKRKPTRDNLQILADIFNVDIDYLMGRESVSMRYLSSIELEIIDKFRKLDMSQQDLVLNMLGIKRDTEQSQDLPLRA